MTCPKCNEGVIGKILFKKSKKIGFLCDFCGAMWLENETINETSGHIINSFTKEGEIEYTFIDMDRGEESKSVMYPIFK